MKKAFFVDKDGTLVDNDAYPPVIPTDNVLWDDVIEGLAHITNKGYDIIICSNQPWIAKNLLTKEQVEKTFASVVKQLQEKGIRILDYAYCPHQSSDQCACKKPKPQLLLDAAKKHNINLSESFMVGDTADDIIAGKNAGTKTILVLTGKGKEFRNSVSPTHIIKNINAIIRIV